MRDKKILTGLLFIIAGIGLVVNKLGYFEDINIFGFLATVYLVYWIARGVRRRSIFAVLVPLSLIGVIYWDYLGIASFNPWILVWAAVLVSIGLSIIFRPRKRFKVFGKFRHENSDSYEEVDGVIYIDSVFSECIRYLNSDSLEKVKLDSSFGSMKIFFDNVKPKDGQLIVDLDASFSGIELYVPKEWEVINRMDVSFGSVNEKSRNTGEKTKTIILKGDGAFCGVDIIYI